MLRSRTVDTVVAADARPAIETAAQSPAGQNTAARKLLRVLEAVSNPGDAHRLGDLVAQTGLAKTSVYRILAELTESGYVTRNGDGTYAPGRALRLLALKTTAQTTHSGLVHARLLRLQGDVRNTIHFALRTGDTAIYIEKIEDTTQPFKIASRVGSQLALHSTAIGKAILAQLSEAEVRAYAARTGLPARTRHTLTEVDAVLTEVGDVRARGFAVNDEENEEHLRCLAVPVFDPQGNVIGGLGVTTIAPLVPREMLEACAPMLRAAAKDITGLL
jgi:IclR family acetate operon transcriptional repressor